MRGVEPTAVTVRQEFSIVEGRMFEFGTNEVIAGRGAAGQFSGLEVDHEIRLGQVTWRVVGIFETDGSVAETEVWSDARTIQGAYRRGNSYQTVLARLDPAESFTAFRDWLTSTPAQRRSGARTSYLAVARLTTLVRIVGWHASPYRRSGAISRYTAVAARR
jgi:putative ABC transport system permease protein